MIRKLQLPISEEEIRTLRCGDQVELYGVLFTGRDAVHKYLHDGHPAPVDFTNGAIYHCGPVITGTVGNWQVSAAGPTTSMREEPYMADLIEKYQLRAVIGKGGMGPATLKACHDFGCVYLNAIGGCAQLLADKIVAVQDVFLKDEFGAPEAIWQLEVNGFTAVVTMDANGDSLHQQIADTSADIQQTIFNV